jgi:hypothetical protein
MSRAFLFSLLLGLILAFIGRPSPSLAAQSDPAAELRSILGEAKTVLLAAKAADLDQDYRLQLEKAMVLYYQASLYRPEDPEVWLRLGRLAEIRGLWAEDPQNREELMEEARGHFFKAASLGFEQAHPETPEPKTLYPSPDPFVAELLWSGRLKRGEVTAAELIRHYSFNDLNPLYCPGLWSDRRYLLLAVNDPLERAALAKEYEDEFNAVWATMPARALNPKPDSPPFKKIDVLLAFADTLLFLSGPHARDGQNPHPALGSPDATPDATLNATPGVTLNANPIANPIANQAEATAAQSATALENQGDPASLREKPASEPQPPAPASKGPKATPIPAAKNKASTPLALIEPADFFDKALTLWPKGLALALEPFDLDLLLARLDKAESFAPNLAKKEALWALKDRIHERRLKAPGSDVVAAWRAYGEDFYRRASSLIDDRAAAAADALAAKKMAQAVLLSPIKDRVHASWGRTLERKAEAVAAMGDGVPESSKASRYLNALTLARDQYRLAWELGQSFDSLESLARVSVLLAYETKDPAAFVDLFQKATTLGRQAVRASDNPAAAWLSFARALLAFNAQKDPPKFLRERAVAEIFAAYNHYLSLNPASVPDLAETADGIWAIAAR